LSTRQILIVALLVIAIAVRTAAAAEPKLLSDPAQVSRADRAIVFVHGLMGSPDESFGDWPKIIAADNFELPEHGKLSDLAVYAVDYQADFKTSTKLDDVAIGVSRDLAASQVFRRHRHVWLVTHSMGGLVVKRTMARWILENKTVLVDRVVAIGMLGVPSAGAPLADLAKKHGIDTIATTFGWNGELVKDLTTNGGSYLDGLESDWMAAKRFRDTHQPQRLTPIISCGFETKPEIDRGFWSTVGLTAVGRLLGEDIDATVVPKLFTSSACDERRAFPVKHTNLIKPVDARDPLHVWLRDLINRSIAASLQENRVELTTSPPASRLTESGKVAFNLAERVDSMNEELRPDKLDPATGLPLNPEQIRFTDDKSRQLATRLVLRDGPFRGDTKLSALERAAERNKCLDIAHSPNRLTITVGIQGQTMQCAAGALVCAGQSCN
jgi:pimeloyl-ACP methyl ester carboxylesterase